MKIKLELFGASRDFSNKDHLEFNIKEKIEIKEFRKKSKEKPLLKGAFAEESIYIGDDQLDALVDIKSREELIGEIIGLLQSPAKNVISALQSGGQTLSGILKTLSEK